MSDDLADLRGTRFENADLHDARFTMVDLTGATFRAVGFHQVVMRGVEITHTTIDGEIEDLVINGVDVAPLIEAELDRRYPDRPLFRPTTADGFRHAWDLNERLWATTVERARRLPPERLHESVGRGVVLHRDAASPGVRVPVLGGPCGAGRPHAVAPAVPAVGRDAPAPGCARATVTRDRRSTRRWRCGWPRWRWCARWSTA